MNDLDDEVRAATFAFIERLRTRFASRIPAKELSTGITVRGQRVPIWNQQKGIFKPAALGRDGAALSIQTSAESPYADVHDVDAGEFVYMYRGTNANHHDNVALREAMVQRRPLLYLIAVDPGVYDAIYPVYVQSDDSRNLQFGLVADQIGSLQPGATDTMAAARRAYMTRTVMQRLHQEHFRAIVLRAYSDRCAICRLGHRDLLDAAHILADKHPLGEPIVTNGLGLCKIHHSAFDARILGIDPDARVHIRRDILAETDGPMLKHGLQEIHGARLTLPRRIALRPNRDFLAERFEAFTAG